MARGDHVWVRRVGYSHHGVEVDDDMVVHFTGTPGHKMNAVIRRDTINDFAHGHTAHVRLYGRRLDPDETVKLAESKIGQSGYNLYGNNCEHFARSCVTGDHRSSQVDVVRATGGVGASTAVAAGGFGVISAVGTTAGLSGPGIMSGLAASGAVIGSGAVGGLVVLGALPGAMSVVVMNVALRDDEALLDHERAARGVGRKASAVGALGGSAAGVAAVSAVGSVAGLSAAGISSGLATIGAVVGGGMAAGSVVVIAAPAIAAAGVGYGAYRATRRAIRPPAEPTHKTRKLRQVGQHLTESGAARSSLAVAGRIESRVREVVQNRRFTTGRLEATAGEEPDGKSKADGLPFSS
jgi:hypothetical protein